MINNIGTTKIEVIDTTNINEKMFVQMFPSGNVYSEQIHWLCCCYELMKDLTENTKRYNNKYKFFRYFNDNSLRIIDTNEVPLKYCPHCGERIIFQGRLYERYDYYIPEEYKGTECESIKFKCTNSDRMSDIGPLPDDWRAELDPARNP